MSDWYILVDGVPASAAILGASAWLHGRNCPTTPIIGGITQAHRDIRLAREALRRAKAAETGK